MLFQTTLRLPTAEGPRILRNEIPLYPVYPDELWEMLSKPGFGGGLGMLTTPVCVLAFGSKDAIGILLPLLWILRTSFVSRRVAYLIPPDDNLETPAGWQEPVRNT